MDTTTITSLESTGRERLKAFLHEHHLTLRTAGAAIGVSHIAVRGWLMGDQRPRTRARKMLEKWTGGAVPAVSWETLEEQAALDALQPFGSEIGDAPARELREWR